MRTFSCVASFLFASVVFTSVHAQTPILAFPEAEGFGRYSQGGRGGQVMPITNLDDTGVGSLRACAEAAGPRICIFHVSGIIDLVDRISIENPFLTIAGQTAPADGITVRGMVSIRTHDVIVRHVRFRPGPRLIPAPSNTDALQIVDSAHDIILDHVSLSWATDEVFSVSGSQGITLQWSIVSESLDCPDEPFRHEEGCHGKGFLVSGGATDLSFHHNLLAHHPNRNPLLTSGNIDFLNSVIYNHGDHTRLNPTQGILQVNIVGNHYIPGADSKDKPPVRLEDGQLFSGDSSVFFQGNIDTVYRQDNTLPEEDVISRRGDLPQMNIASVPFNFPSITSTDAFQALAEVLAEAGANRRLNADGSMTTNRDPVDTRVANDVMNGSGRHINMPADVGDYPNIPLSVRPPEYDADLDGMPDVWEGIYGFNPDDALDGPLDSDGDGYSNLEEFLNGTLPIQASGIPITVTITAPLSEAIVNGFVLVTAETAEVESVDHVDFYVNGNLIGSDSFPSYEVLWNTATVNDGPVILSAIAVGFDSRTANHFVNVAVNNQNDSPLAFAGPDQTVSDADDNGNEPITLNGSTSFDPDGTIVSYEWTEGTSLLGSGATLAVNFPVGIHAVALTVLDDGGASSSDEVIFTVLANQPPVADAGVDQTVSDGDVDGVESVTLDGRDSFDPDGTIMAYEWREGAVVIGTTRSVTQDLAIGTHTFTLMIVDNAGERASDEVVVNVLSNQPPVAAAGADQAISDADGNGTETVSLDGSESFDPDGTIASYAWSEGTTVLGSTLTLPAQIFDIGIHTVTLTITDNAGGISSDQVILTISPNQPPVANAGTDQIVNDKDNSGQELITLNGTGSFDPDGRLVAYEWKDGPILLATTPIGSTSLPYGVHTYTLTVTDSGGAAASDMVVVTVNANQSPIADAGPDQVIMVGEVASFDASGSFDPDGMIVSHEWDFGDGTAGSGMLTSHVYAEPGLYTVTLSVTDDGGASSSDVVSQTVAVFFDNFEIAEWNGLWIEDSQIKWVRSTQRAIDGVFSAEVEGPGLDATLTSTPINLQGRTNATIEFSWLIEETYDNNEYLAFDVSTDGAVTWNEMARLQGNIDQENVWQSPRIDIINIQNLQIRFRASASRDNEDANVDLVKVVAWAGSLPPPITDAGSSTVTTTASTVPADGTSTATITVTLLDSLSAPVAGHTVSLAQGPGSSTILPASGTSAANGQVTFTVSSTTAESITYTAMDLTAGISILQTVELTFAPPTTPGDVFADSFEVSEWNGLWTEDSLNQWARSSQRAVDGTFSAQVVGSETSPEALLTSIPIDLQGRNAVTIDFAWLIGTRFDNNEYLAFDVSTDGGDTWTERARLRGNVAPEDTWQAVSLSAENIASVQLRFRGKASKANEYANIDSVVVRVR